MNMSVPSRRPSQEQTTTNAVDRRLFLQRMAKVGAGAAVAPWVASCARTPVATALPFRTRELPPPMPEVTTPTLATSHIAGRILVIVDLDGGNDGLSMVPPVGSPGYHDLRPQLAHNDVDVLSLDDRLGLSPRLQRLYSRGVTTVEGVGPIDGDQSHFAMSARWQQGDVTGDGLLRSGYLGRLADALATDSPLTGVSLAGPSPYFANSFAPTMSLDGPDDLWFLKPTDWEELQAFQTSMGMFAGTKDGHTMSQTLSALVPEGYDQLLDLGSRLTTLGEEDIDWDSPMLSEGAELGEQLWGAAELIDADVGVRVVYTSLGGFDTHQDHQWTHDDLMGSLDAAVGGFLDRADELGFGDRVTVATVSEFGRRVRENESGLDHGSGSTMLVVGPTTGNQLGTATDFNDLDPYGNIRVTTGFDDYLGSLAEEWLGIDAESVLPNQPTLLGLM